MLIYMPAPAYACNATNHKPQNTCSNLVISYGISAIDSKDELEEHLANCKSTGCSDSENDTAGSQISEQEKMVGPKRKRKLLNENRAEIKKKKDAQQAVNDDTAKRILAQQPCTKCDQLKDEIKRLKEKLSEKEGQMNELVAKNSDLQSSVTAKRSVIADLEGQLQVEKASTLSAGITDIFSYNYVALFTNCLIYRFPFYIHAVSQFFRKSGRVLP